MNNVHKWIYLTKILFKKIVTRKSMFALNYPAVLIVIFVSLVLKDLVMLAVQVLFVSERIFLYLILILKDFSFFLLFVTWHFPLFSSHYLWVKRKADPGKTSASIRSWKNRWML